ncbi:lymphocyte antigen 6 complex locus protein G6c-like [Chelydra serpentina]|uniref:Lymphocyte antigen 6 complex locus protein G6c-like n=1 Tax=Chelydra serpentina TaxID=8475 RepID=A0A8T1SC94_CHESE|nr:lymphocyte antigen 6 complex locus protein G6c-like [Chelydra serpentina]
MAGAWGTLWPLFLTASCLALCGFFLLFPAAEALRCTICENKIPVFGCIKGQGICHPPPGLPCKLIRVYTSMYVPNWALTRG